MRAAGYDTAMIELLDSSPYPRGIPESEPLRRALATLRSTAESILGKYGFGWGDESSIQPHAAPAPWDATGFELRTRTLITDADARVYDSRWLPK